VRTPLSSRDLGSVGVRDPRLVGQLPPPELFAVLFIGIAILLMLVGRF